MTNKLITTLFALCGIFAAGCATNQAQRATEQTAPEITPAKATASSEDAETNQTVIRVKTIKSTTSAVISGDN